MPSNPGPERELPDAMTLRDALQIEGLDADGVLRLEDGIGDILAILALSDLERDISHATKAIRDLARRALGRDGSPAAEG